MSWIQLECFANNSSATSVPSMPNIGLSLCCFHCSLRFGFELTECQFVRCSLSSFVFILSRRLAILITIFFRHNIPAVLRNSLQERTSKFIFAEFRSNRAQKKGGKKSKENWPSHGQCWRWKTRNEWSTPLDTFQCIRKPDQNSIYFFSQSKMCFLIQHSRKRSEKQLITRHEHSRLLFSEFRSK